MFESPFVDELLIRIFRFRTRGFLAMQETDGAVPPVPQSWSRGALAADSVTDAARAPHPQRTTAADANCYLYVHIPFCEVLCPFCSFHRVQHCHEQAARYFKALRTEIDLYHAAGFKFSGVYFGGGTPTVEPDELLATIAHIRRLFGVPEISVETNPKDLQPALLAQLRAAGVTRLSVGVQSFDDQLLREMERYEKYGSGQETAERIRAAASLFPTLNVDLIFNQPHQTRASLELDLAIFRTLGANQISTYPLMTSPTVRRRMAGPMGTPDGRRLRKFYQVILRGLAPEFAPSSAWCFTRGAGGTDEYIVAAENYVGVGSGAFSYLDGTLYSTTFSLHGYESRLACGLTGITTRHRLSETDRLRYTLLVHMFGLRLDEAWARAHHGDRFFRKLWAELRALEVLGAAIRDARGWQLTERGMYLLMLMMSEFFESVNGYRDAMRAHIKDELEPTPAFVRRSFSALALRAT